MFQQVLHAKAELFHALADPARLTMLELLADRDHTVAEIMAKVRLDPALINAHLHELRRQRLVNQVRTGHEVLYSLNAPELPNLLSDARRILSRLEDIDSGG